MLQSEDIAKVQEVKGKFNKFWLDTDYLQSYLNILGFQQIKKKFKSCKQSGYSFGNLISTLLLLPVMGLKTINELTSNKESSFIDKKSAKDSYYRILANQKINWRDFLFKFVKQYLLKDKDFQAPSDTTKCLIFDDTDLAKTGKTIEGISKIFNHVSKKYYLGFKLLVAGYWNGSVFIPIDFSLHRESKNSKLKYGLTKKQRNAQKKTERCNKTPVAKRYNELNKKKTDVLVQMFARVISRKIPVDYILIDTWFTSMGLIKRLRKISSSTHIIGMYKYNSKIKVGTKKPSIAQLKKQKTKPKRCRKFNYYYHHYISEIDGVAVSVFISKRGRNGKWHTLITTDIKLKFVRAIEIYSTRWTIEVFFKEAKQLFGLGKCQSTNFDVQVAQITITMTQYLLVSIKYRMEAYETIGGMFRSLKQDYIQDKLNIRILAVIYLIIDILEKLIEPIDIERIISKIIANIEDYKILVKTQTYGYQ